MKKLSSTQMAQLIGGTPNGWCVLGWTLLGFSVGGTLGAAVFIGLAAGGLCQPL